MSVTINRTVETDLEVEVVIREHTLGSYAKIALGKYTDRTDILLEVETLRTIGSRIADALREYNGDDEETTEETTEVAL